MAKLSTIEIEMLTVHAINTKATKLNNMMEASIAIRDTKVSFDGTIELFSDRLHRVSDW
ncbi:hypothetical protein ACE3MZ_13025 [Paenibacillus sp. WLX1005]|uniref:hypothetical protein n=1 Tax=Paenibacillus sp. WLX1005 TaxID=3243766 RepID=UPI0039841E2D